MHQTPYLVSPLPKQTMPIYATVFIVEMPPKLYRLNMFICWNMFGAYLCDEMLMMSMTKDLLFLHYLLCVYVIFVPFCVLFVYVCIYLCVCVCVCLSTRSRVCITPGRRIRRPEEGIRWLFAHFQSRHSSSQCCAFKIHLMAHHI